MDPNANLEEQRHLARLLLDNPESADFTDAQRLAELVQALDEWIMRGGFLPRSWHDDLERS